MSERALAIVAFRCLAIWFIGSGLIQAAHIPTVSDTATIALPAATCAITRLRKALTGSSGCRLCSYIELGEPSIETCVPLGSVR